MIIFFCWFLEFIPDNTEFDDGKHDTIKWGNE